jgi:hypothetical protein
MKQKSPPNWSLIIGLYAVAALFLVIVRDELGTDNDPQMKAGGWIALTFAVYWSLRALIAWGGTAWQLQRNIKHIAPSPVLENEAD